VRFDIEDSLQQAAGNLQYQGITNYSKRSLTPQQATGNALAPRFKKVTQLINELLTLEYAGSILLVAATALTRVAVHSTAGGLYNTRMEGRK
jgi:hypothetical protein